MNKATIIRNIPNPKQVSDNLRIPMPTPETVETVAIAVMTQMMIICKNKQFMDPIKNTVPQKIVETFYSIVGISK